MPKPTNEAIVAEPNQVSFEQVMSIEDWCQQRSISIGRSVESLAAFYSKMQKLKINRLSADEWESRFQSFLSAPAVRG
jgi:hypothetical protein